MVATLPPTIQLKLDQTLSQWHSWRCVPALTEKPTISHLLSPGLSNYSILVHANQPLVVRIDGLNPTTIGLSRQTEWRVLQLASAAGLAPHPRYYNPELGSLVYDYLEKDVAASSKFAAATLTAESVAATAMAATAMAATAMAATAHLLRQIHQLPPVHFRLDLRERILRYEKHVEHRGDSASPILADARSRIMAIIERTDSEGQAQVLCHKCSDGLRALTGYSNTYNKTLSVLGNNVPPSFHLNGSLSTPIRPLRFWLKLKCLQRFPEWFYIRTGYDACVVPN